MAQTDEAALLRELYAGLATVRTQQTEINRRLGNIEEKLEDDLVDPARVTRIEEDMAERKGWTTWVLQIVGQVILVTALVAAGKVIGVEVSW